MSTKNLQKKYDEIIEIICKFSNSHSTQTEQQKIALNALIKLAGALELELAKRGVL